MASYNHRDLVLLFIKNSLSAQQMDALQEFMQRDPAQFEALMNEPEVLLLIEQQMKKTSPELSADRVQRFQDRIQEAVAYADNDLKNNGKRPPLRIAGRSYPWRKYAAAAAVIAVLCTGTWLWFNHKPGVQGTEVHAPLAQAADIPPGRNGAILTLSGGQQVVLDSLNNGVIAKQGASTVLISNKQLVYNTTAREDAVMYNTVTTTRGRQYQLVLPDGSRVWLNAASSIRYPTAAGDSRIVTITGEAYFEIAKDKSRPFIVKANGMDIEVLGTQFNVNSYADEMGTKTTLFEGKVKVVGGAGYTLLKPGEQATVATSGGGTAGGHAAISVRSGVNLGAVIAWKEGKFQFDKTPLPAVMRQLSRWYDMEVVYQGPVPQRDFGGEMERDLSLSEVLEGFSDMGVHFKIEGKKLIVTAP